MTELALPKLQTLLRTLFQFNAADLNFGIYRVLNYKRAEIEAFIDVRLPQIAEEAFARYAATDRAKLEGRLQELRQALSGGFDEAGNLKPPFDQLELGKEYLEIQSQVAALSVADELKTRVYNDLYTFFNRYYEDGDFISKRRRGRDETYAVPYNGEEVMLHWANRDQYYIKTDERLAAYRFHVGEFHVAFEVRAAETTTNNNKSENRFYVLASDPVAWDADARLLTVGFQHRALTESEAITFGKTGQQDKINVQTAETVLAAVSDTILRGLLGRVPQGSDKSDLLKHLGQFTRRNTLDFFIHKDLKGFLTRELDHFIKTEALRLDDLLTDHADAFPTQVQRARATRDVALSLIDLLAQVEDFQKRLFEKKKFVLRTDYCLTLDRVPENLWPEVLENEAQKADWQNLYVVDEIMATDGVLNTGMGADFLRAHPALMIDTHHFSDEFKWRLVSALDDFDAETDGVLFHSENFQALNLLLAKYGEKVDLTFIDSPYNTGADGFLYKDSYQHSAWLSMMENRLTLCRALLSKNGLLFMSIDFVEVSKLRLLCDETFGATNFLADIAWEKRYTRSNNAKRFYSLKDTILAYRRSEGLDVLKEVRGEKSKVNYTNPDNDPRGPWISSSYVNPATKEKRPNLVYVIKNPTTGNEKEHPTHAWKYDISTHQEHIKDKRLYWGLEGDYEFPRLKSFLSDASLGVVPIDFWSYKDSGTTDEGGNEVKSLFGKAVFDNPKPTALIRRCLQLDPLRGEATQILDFFGGSGTTGDAVIKLNREDGGTRKYVLVEMGEYFPTVLLPRLKKAVYCPDWKDGKPVGGDGISHTIKYHTLEQYEDTLNNLDVQQRAAEGKQAALHFGDEYLLRYMLDFETQGSPSLLNLDALADPFDYKLNIKQGDEIKPHPVDLLETFNYLLGLTVIRLRSYQGQGEREYRAVLGEKDGKRIVVIWRKASDLAQSDAALAQDKAFIENTLLPSLLGDGSSQNRLYVNSPCAALSAEAVEPEFKRLMFEEAL